MNFYLLFFTLLILPIKIKSQDTLCHEKPKAGWNMGLLPSISYNTDKGFQYGAFANIFYYGDGTKYPEYLHNIYLELSRTTLGNGINQFFFDSKKLLPCNIRFTSDISYFTHDLFNFYGFNGYNAVYNPSVEEKASDQYISRVYYKLNRSFFKMNFDIQQSISHSAFRWILGLGFFKIKIKPVDIDKLNKELSDGDKLPKVPTLYEKYVTGNVIPEGQEKGGNNTFLKTGIVYDTRDNEPNPMKGLWIEGILLTSPNIIGNKISFSQYSLIFRHYITLAHPILNLGYRIAYQNTLSGKKPFYMLPFFFSSYKTLDALGGVKTLRGILQNRVQGDGLLFGNIELRYKVLRTRLFNQNFYFALSTFTDGGMVTNPYKIPANANTSGLNIINGEEALHMSAGCGLHIAMNQNFIIAIDYGRAFDKKDGNHGIYLDLDFLF